MNYPEFLNTLLNDYKTVAAKKRFLTMEIRSLNDYKAEINDIIANNNGVYGYRYGAIVTNNDIAQIDREIKAATELRKTL